MKNFKIEGYFKYSGICETINANSQKEALEQVLIRHCIKYDKLLKMTTKENEKLIAKGIEPYTWIDFTVSNVDAKFSMTGTGNWHIIE